MKSRLGNDYYILKLAAFEKPKKRDDKFDMIWLIQELKKINYMVKEKKEKREMCCGGKFVKKYCALHMGKAEKKTDKKKEYD